MKEASATQSEEKLSTLEMGTLRVAPLALAQAESTLEAVSSTSSKKAAEAPRATQSIPIPVWAAAAAFGVLVVGGTFGAVHRASLHHAAADKPAASAVALKGAEREHTDPTKDVTSEVTETNADIAYIELPDSPPAATTPAKKTHAKKKTLWSSVKGFFSSGPSRHG